MKMTKFHPCVWSVFWTLWCAASGCHAEIYKWVDEQGKTHYSGSKEDAGRAKTEEVKVKPLPASPASPALPAHPPGQEMEKKLRQLRAPGFGERPVEPPANTAPRSLSGGKSDESNASRCNLARDVLSGAVKHRNGAPTDQYDRDVAQNDIRTFCRQ